MRDERLSTSVSEETKQKFRVLAAQRGLTMSEFLRMLVLEEIQSSEEAEEGNGTRRTATAD